MKKRIISLFLSLLLCFSLATIALAAGGFDASVTVERETEGRVYVTVSASDDILAEKVPTLTVPCDFENAEVVFAGTSIDCIVSDGQVSFPVAAKGTYVIVALREVSFNDGTSATTRAVRHGVAIAEPKAPAKTGYTFAGWYSDEELTKAYDFSTPVTEDITLYAKWKYAPAEDDDDYYIPIIPTVSTSITTNSDGSTTTTVTNNRTGTVTKTTENVDGSVTTVETKKNGTVTETVENTDGSTVTIVTKKDGFSTATTELADGTTATITTDVTGEIQTDVVISEKAFETVAQTGTAVVLPIPAVENTTNSETATVITVTTNSETATTVAIPVAEVSTSTVAVLVDADGNDTIITETKMTENGLIIDVPDGAVVKIVDKAVDFTDVSSADWEQDAVNFASARGLVNGVGGNSFDLDGVTTRAHVVTLLARLAGLDTTPEEGQMWYSKGEAWAVANGITYAGNMNGAITRHEMMTLLWRYMGSPVSDHDLSHFTDAHELNSTTAPAARWAVEIGLIGGHGNGTMTPTANVTRGQLAQFMMNFIQIT